MLHVRNDMESDDIAPGIGSEKALLRQHDGQAG